MDLNALQELLGTNVVPSDSLSFSQNVLQKNLIGGALEFLLDQMFSSYQDQSWIICLERSDTVLDIIWEHLNTGYWKDVNICWRYVYTIASWIKALCQVIQSGTTSDNDMIKTAIKTCDMGLLMGAPVNDNILTKLVAKLQEHYVAKYVSDDVSSEPEQKKQKVDIPEIQFDIEILCNPTMELFHKEYMQAQTPVVIHKSMDYWPAMSDRRWNLDYIKKIAGCRTVPIEIGSRYTDDEWSQSLMTIDEFINKYIENTSNNKGYLAQHQLFNQIPELQRDISVPSYCGLGENTDVDINAWFGPTGTISPLHQDPKHNLLCQIVGEKYIRLYALEHTDLVYPHESRLFSNTSQVDVENPDLDKFPKFADAPFVECVLKPGEMLYIPPKCWHYVRSLAISFSVSFWWE